MDAKTLMFGLVLARDLPGKERFASAMRLDLVPQKELAAGIFWENERIKTVTEHQVLEDEVKILRQPLEIGEITPPKAGKTTTIHLSFLGATKVQWSKGDTLEGIDVKETGELTIHDTVATGQEHTLCVLVDGIRRKVMIKIQ